MKSPTPLSLAQEWQGSPQHCNFKGCQQDEVQLTLTCPALCPKEGTGKYQLSPSSSSEGCLEPKSQQPSKLHGMPGETCPVLICPTPQPALPLHFTFTGETRLPLPHPTPHTLPGTWHPLREGPGCPVLPLLLPPAQAHSPLLPRLLHKGRV